MSTPLGRSGIDRYDGIAASIALAPPSDADERRAGEADTVVDRMHPHRLSLEVAEVIAETASATTLRMTSTGPPLPPFLAGQYVNLFLELDGTRTSRPYAISSSPTQLGHYDLTVRELIGGFVSPYLARKVKPGDRFASTAPMGEFFHNPLFHGDRLMFLAGGSGVAAARSMIADLAARGSATRVHLVYGSKDPNDVIFRAEIDELSRVNDNVELTYVISEPDLGWHGRTGFITTALIAELAGSHLHATTFYLCGPPPMYTFCLDALHGLGVPARRIRYEANGPPAHPERIPAWPDHLDPASTVTVSVHGRGQFTAPCGEPLLISLERAGYQLQAGCRSGHCSLCRVKILAGTIINGPDARIRRSDEWAGHTHACTAFPTTNIDVQL